MDKKQIREAETVDLASRAHLLLGKAEDTSGNDSVNMAELEEVATIDRELKSRLGRCMKFKNAELMKLILKNSAGVIDSFLKEELQKEVR